MYNKIPAVVTVMTPFPHAIDANATVGSARTMMDEERIRHLPVKTADSLLGLVTERELRGVAPDIAVGSVAITNAYIVDTEEPLDNVLVHLASKQIGSVLVTKDGRLVGIFTTTDACRLFGDWLRYHYRPPADDDAA
jgi:acetoin utilization protein AcuB